MQWRVSVVVGLCVAVVTTSAQQIALPTTIDEESLLKSEARRYSALASAIAKPVSDQHIDVTYYKLDLAVSTSPEYLRGIVTVKAKNIATSINSVALDLMNTMAVDSVKSDGGKLSFVQSPATVTITLDRMYAQGELVSVHVYYRGVPESTGFGSFSFATHTGTPWVYTLSEPYGARDWWPCNDHPSDKADSVDVWVTVANGLKVGSNGKLVAVVDNGNGTVTYRWAERYPISTYLVSMAITNYAEFTNWFRYSETDSMPVLNYVLPEHLENAQSSLPKTVDMLRIFSELFGLYPFIKEKYGHAEFGWGGGMEHQTMTSLGSFSENLVAHELAHMWFGDMITCASWPNIWLNEGFATYSVALYRGAFYGNPAYKDYMNGRMNSALAAAGPVYVRDTTDVSTLFDGRLVYAKGAAVLHMLRRVLGDSIFFRSIRAYADDPRFRFGVANTENFMEVCETVSGSSLDYFFNQWIYGERYPQYVYSWHALPDTDGGFVVPIRIRQSTGTGNPSFFTMPVDVRLSGPALDTTIVLWNDTLDQTFTIHVPEMPVSLQFDPDNWILKTTTLASVGEETASATPGSFRLDQNYPNPFNPKTTIRYATPGGTYNYTSLQVFDVLGQEVATLVDGWKSPGTYEVEFDGARFSSGIYIYRMRVGSTVESRTMLLLK